MRSTADYKAAITAIRSVIAAWDPYALIEGGAPPDEFDSEVARLASRVRRIDSAESAAVQVAEVFSEAFEPSLFELEACREVGMELFKKLSAAGLCLAEPGDA